MKNIRDLLASSPSLWAQYYLERERIHSFEFDFGFISFFYHEDGRVHIVDIFVKKALRIMGIAADMADLVGVEASKIGIREMVGYVAPLDKNAETNEKVLKAYGMEYFKDAPDGRKMFKKEIT